jgi:hypothetical protein
MWFRKFLIVVFIISHNAGYAKSGLTLLIQQQWQCTPANEVSMRFGTFDEYCVNDFVCHKSGEYEKDVSSTILVGKGTDCPTTVEGYAERERDVEATKGIGSIIAPREADKPNTAIHGCKINPAFLNDSLVAHLV